MLFRSVRVCCSFPEAITANAKQQRGDAGRQQISPSLKTARPLLNAEVEAPNGGELLQRDLISSPEEASNFLANPDRSAPGAPALSLTANAASMEKIKTLLVRRESNPHNPRGAYLLLSLSRDASLALSLARSLSLSLREPSLLARKSVV